MIHIEKKGRRIEVHSREPLPGMKTTVPGAYLTSAGHWTVPLSMESCKLLRQKFQGRLVVGSELRRWAIGVRQNRAYMAKLAAAGDARLDVLPKVAPRLYKAMRRRKYQRAGVRFVADNHATLVADEPGLGKTLIAMGGILEAEIPGPYLVVAPKTAADTVWRREITRWLPADHNVIILPEFRYQRELKLRRSRYTDKTWLIIHPEIAMVQSYWECAECKKRYVETSKQIKVLPCKHDKTKQTKRMLIPSYKRLFELKWGAIVVDESHESLIVRSRSHLTQRRRGIEMLNIRGDGIRIAMSGTPFDSKPHQLWGTLNWLDSKHYSAFHRWAELYWQKGGYTGFQIGEFRADREKMLWDSLSSIAIRRTKIEVAKDLPPKMHVGTLLDPHDDYSPVGIWLPMHGEQDRAYKEMELLSIAHLDSGRLDAISSLAELTRLKQMACAYGDIYQETVKVSCAKSVYHDISQPKCAIGYHEELKFRYKPKLPSNKFEWIVENLEEWGYPKNPLTKVVIVSFYTGILETFRFALESHFKTRMANPLCTAINGRTPMKDRRDIIDRFNQSGNERIMLLNVKAGGTAITLDSADRMIFISETRIPDQQAQAEDRIHRVSNPRQCMYYYLRSLGSVDVGTAIDNQSAIQDSHRLLDGRRGIAYTRHIIDLSHGVDSNSHGE